MDLDIGQTTFVLQESNKTTYFLSNLPERQASQLETVFQSYWPSCIICLSKRRPSRKKSGKRTGTATIGNEDVDKCKALQIAKETDSGVGIVLPPLTTKIYFRMFKTKNERNSEMSELKAEILSLKTEIIDLKSAHATEISSLKSQFKSLVSRLDCFEARSRFLSRNVKLVRRSHDHRSRSPTDDYRPDLRSEN